MKRKRTKRFLLSIAAVSTGVGIVACGGSSAVGSVIVGSAPMEGGAPGDGGDGGVSTPDGAVGTVPMPDDGGRDAAIVGIGVIVHPDAGLGD